MDGIPLANKGDNRISLRPSPDAVQEFQIVTNSLAFNIFNRPNFQAPGTAFGAANFGVITGTEDPRQIQFAARIYF